MQGSAPWKAVSFWEAASVRSSTVPTRSPLNGFDKNVIIVHNNTILAAQKESFFVKTMKKYLSLLCFSAVLLLLAAFGAVKSNIPLHSDRTDLPRFLVESPSGKAQELTVFAAGNETYYVFLPSYASLEQVSVAVSSDHGFSIENTPLLDGMDCGTFKPDTPYPFTTGSSQSATLWFYRSENTATLYVDTVSGTMKHIHKDINLKEGATVTLYTADGTVDCYDENSFLKGRGNTTWEKEKRPYSLTLSRPGNLLGMGEATNWVLLANAYDDTNLRNKLVLDLASRSGLRWTPESRWVDVYLNGEYSGLYLLTEKIEVAENRLNIDAESGDFLCKIDPILRMDKMRDPFLTAAGRPVEISYPGFLTRSNRRASEQLINRMEEIILSGEDLRDSTLIDLDSWIRRYLIDEISGNVDSDHASSYFYYTDGRFYAGPVWDYDLAFGNSDQVPDPVAFYTTVPQKTETYQSSLYHSALYKNESFHREMVDVYRTEFLPLLQQLLDSEIETLAASIRKASYMNGLRWQHMFEAGPDQQRTASDLTDYLERRVAFLNHVWLDGADYCTVQFEPIPGGLYQNLAVEMGSCLETALFDTVYTVWVDAATGEVFDFSQPVKKDVVLREQNAGEAGSKDTAAFPDAKTCIVLLSIGVLLITLTGFVIVDTGRRQKEGSTVHARTYS